MIGEHKVRINLTLHELTGAMLETLSKETGLTKSQIMQQLLRNYTLNFWSKADEEIERWKKYAAQEQEKKARN